MVLKTVEFVVTGVTGSDVTQPLSVMVEVFGAICENLLLRTHGLEQDSTDEERLTDGLLADANMICETLEKLVQFELPDWNWECRKAELTSKRAAA